MQELIAQLVRLYLPPDTVASDTALQGTLARHVAGDATHAFDLASNGMVRAFLIGCDGAGGWERLCVVANALQAELGLPAPAVSVSGGTGFRLWLSCAEPLPVATAQRFIDLLHAAWLPDTVPPDVTAPVALPPCRVPATGKWAAFIHPGMGASFADEPALDMPPPAAAQAAFLEGLRSIDADQLRLALVVLEAMQPVPAPPVPAQPAAAPAAGAVPAGLLLKDATLEDIVRYLHSKNIEPTFRHVLPPH